MFFGNYVPLILFSDFKYVKIFYFYVLCNSFFICLVRKYSRILRTPLRFFFGLVRNLLPKLRIRTPLFSHQVRK